jgi:HlyD family secretion protein
MTEEQTSQADLDAFLGTPEDSPWRKRAIWAGAAVILVALLFLLTRCYSNSGISQYITQEAARGPLNVTVSATGNLAPTNQVEVGSEISGTVAQVLVDYNDRVKKGQTLAVIDTDLLDDTLRQSEATLGARQADVNQARATLAEAQATLNRYQQVSKLSGGKVPAKTEMETAIATRDRAEAALRSAEANVIAAQADVSSNATRRQKAVIKAPVTGVVLARKVEPGQTVAASFNTPTLFILAEDLASMQLEVAIDEADVGQVKKGQKATFTVDAYPGQTFPARIERVNVGSNNLASSSSSSSSSNTAAASTSSVIAYDAILTVDNKSGELLPGMTATADISVQSLRDALLVPNSALRFTPGQSGAKSGQQNQGLMTGMTARPRGRSNGGQQERKIGIGSRQTIYVVGDNGEPQPIEVITGPSDGRNTAVTSKDLKPGMEVITGQRAAQ